jgi:hypothetical protein
MGNQKLPIVGNGVPTEAVEAAESFVSGYINSGYDEDFLVLDSCLLSVTNAGADEEDTLLDLEYAYFSIGTEDVRNLNFYGYGFASERIRFYESELTSGGSSGGLSTHPLAGELTPIDCGSAMHKELIDHYRDSVDKSEFEDRLFEIITEDGQLDEAIFSFSEVCAFDDVRTFFEAATKTLSELKSGSFNLNADEQWWSDIYELDASNIAMFERILEWRLGRLKKRIKSVASEILADQKFLLKGNKVLLEYDGEKIKFVSQTAGPCLVIELINGPLKNKLAIGSALHIVESLKESGSSTIPLDGIFASEEGDSVYLITNLTKVEAERLVDATASKTGVWLKGDNEAEVLNKKNYYSFDRFMYV